MKYLMPLLILCVLNANVVFSNTGGDTKKSKEKIILDLLDVADKKVSTFQFTDERGDQEIYYSSELVYQSLPEEIEEELSNLFMVTVFKDEEGNAPTPTQKTTYQSVEQILMSEVLGAYWKDGMWKVAESKMESFTVGHPCLSKDGNVLYFVANFDDSKGGTDIYMVEKKDKQWSNPMNLGNFVNTTDDEYFPSLMENQTLRYISKERLTFMEVEQFYDFVSANNTYIDEADEEIEIVDEENTTPTKLYTDNRDFNPLSTDDYSFKIQLGLFRTPNWDILQNEFDHYGEMESFVREDGLTNVRIGIYEDLDIVDELLRSIRKVQGFSSAYVVAFKSGKVTDVADARRVLENIKAEYVKAQD